MILSHKSSLIQRSISLHLLSLIHCQKSVKTSMTTWMNSQIICSVLTIEVNQFLSIQWTSFKSSLLIQTQIFPQFILHLNWVHPILLEMFLTNSVELEARMKVTYQLMTSLKLMIILIQLIRFWVWQKLLRISNSKIWEASWIATLLSTQFAWMVTVHQSS